jgi:uncharacterized protein (TIGR03435 family)
MRIDARELLAVGIFGSKSRLGDRIEMLLRRGRTFSPRASAGNIAVSTVALGALIFAGSLAPRWIAFAQQPARPEFEVASVKLNKSGRGVPSRDIRPGSINYTNVALVEYIELAFDVHPYQVTHGPAVSLADRFDIVAKASAAVPLAQVQLMLQSLLQDRFKLAVHRETREMSVYLLTVAAGGPHLKASEDDGPRGAFVKAGSFNYRRTSMAYLAGHFLSNLPSLGRPVVDRTGLDGVYDFSMRMFDPDAEKSETDTKGDLLRQLDNGLSASLKDLGLKLEPRKTPIEMLVIDHVDKPDAN